MAFGAFAAAVSGLDNIEREQWRQIWPRIRDFSLDRNATVRTAGDAAWPRMASYEPWLAVKSPR